MKPLDFKSLLIAGVAGMVFLALLTYVVATLRADDAKPMWSLVLPVGFAVGLGTQLTERATGAS